jgi:hypothetical protein
VLPDDGGTAAKLKSLPKVKMSRLFTSDLMNCKLTFSRQLVLLLLLPVDPVVERLLATLE